MADTAVVNRAVAAAPKAFKPSGAVVLRVKAVRASIDGAGTAGAYLPALQILAPDGTVMFTAVDEHQTVAAGGSADVTWGPF